jgi:uncharacterized membrane protein YraQ (UPF0718 family)
MQGFGVGAGPAGVLLLTLPSLSLPSLFMIGKAFPRRALLLMAGLAVVVGLVSGGVAIALGL